MGDSSADGKPRKTREVRRFHRRSSYVASSRLLAGRSSDTIISAAGELQDTEPVTERIAHFGDATPRVSSNFASSLAPANSARSTAASILRPQSRDAPASSAGGNRVAEKPQARRSSPMVCSRGTRSTTPRQLGHRAIEKPSPKAEAEGVLIKRDALLEIVASC